MVILQMNDIVYIDRELTIFTLNTVLAGNLFGLKITTILKIIFTENIRRGLS